MNIWDEADAKNDYLWCLNYFAWKEENENEEDDGDD